MFAKNMSASSGPGSNSMIAASGYWRAYFSIPTFIREWMIARKVCPSTSGSPPWFSLRLENPPRCAGELASNGTSGLTQNSSETPSSSATDACSVLLSAPST